MYQFGTVYPGNVSRPVKRIPGTICFTVLITAHIVILSSMDFSRRKPQPYKETAVIVDISETAATAPEEEPSLPAEVQKEELSSAPEIPVQKVLPGIVPTETSAAEPVPPAPVVSESSAVSESSTAVSDTTPRRVTVSKSVGKAETASAGKSNPQGMSNAEYRALILSHLEKHKIYPQSLRKRGIQGDAGVSFTIRSDGSAVNITSDKGAHQLLAQAAMQTVKAAAPFPVLKDSNTDYAMRVTIRYRLEE